MTTYTVDEALGSVDADGRYNGTTEDCMAIETLAAEVLRLRELTDMLNEGLSLVRARGRELQIAHDAVDKLIEQAKRGGLASVDVVELEEALGGEYVG